MAPRKSTMTESNEVNDGYDSRASQASDSEDWTKLTDISARRRIQNRLAQRNRRRNLKKRKEESEQQGSTPTSDPRSTKQHNELVWVRQTIFPEKGTSKTSPSNRNVSADLLPNTPRHSSPASSQRDGSPALSGDLPYSGWPLVHQDPVSSVEQRNANPNCLPDMWLEGSMHYQPLTPSTQQDMASDTGYWSHTITPQSDTALQGDFILSPPISFPAQYESIEQNGLFGSNYVSDEFNQISDGSNGTRSSTGSSHSRTTPVDLSDISTASSMTDENLLPLGLGLSSNLLSNLNSEQLAMISPILSISSDGSKESNGQILPQSCLSISSDGILNSDGVDTYGHTALHLAAQKGHLPILKLLLDAGFDIDAKNAAGYSALHLAIVEGNPVVAKFLLQQGANSDLCTDAGQTTLHLAAEKGNAALVRMLLDYVSDADLRDAQGQTAFHCAVIDGHEEIVRIMLDRGVASFSKVEF